VQRGFARLVAAVVLALAVYGAWALGERLSRPPDLGPIAVRPAREDRPPGIAQGPPAPPPAAPGEPAAPERTLATVPPPPAAEAAPASPLTLTLPVLGADPARLRDDFDDARGDRRHDAIDILAPRHTPVVAVADGTIEKLFLSKPGGITVYQFDPSRTYAYYYAHLQGYAPGLREQQRVNRGQVIGYVGSSGNAPPDTPHLHFAIYRLGPEKQWWKGTPVNPYPLFRGGR
jgi:murein DD-endopeptidase MepM/ murein hydrolase activator NlpD